MTDRWQCLNCGYVHRGAAAPAQCPKCGAPFTAFVRYEKDPTARFKGVRMLEQRPPGFRYLIIGNSAAGNAAARAIAALDPDGAVTIISEEPDSFYVRPLLPDLIGGMERDEFFGVGHLLAPATPRRILGERAVALDPDSRTVTCESGLTLEYDALLLATGSAPIQVPWPGSEAEGIAYFRTVADAERIASFAREGSHAVVVGGGLLGLEFVRAFLAAGLRITQLVRESRIGAPAIDPRGGAILEQALADLGVEIALEEEVESFEARDGRVCGVRTSKGRTIECDLVGIAIGARPRVELAKAAGLEVDRGVLVDRKFASSAPAVYAAGDVAQAWDAVWGAQRINTSWRNSTEQGELAGIAMAGGAVQYGGAVAANYQLAAGLPFCAIGISNPPEGAEFEVEVAADVQARTFSKLVRRGGTLVGAALVGDLNRAGELEQQIKEGAGAPASHIIIAEAAPAAGPGGGAPPEERPTGMHKMTEENVRAAFAGESQAHIKYLNFAAKAVEEGKENVARLFRAASFAEQVHAGRHLEALKGVGTTSENLAGAIEGESFEVAEMYPAFIAVAIEQDESEAQESFDHAMRAEKVHHGLYERARQAVDGGEDAAIAELWVCDWCGWTMEGEPPARCPICKNPKKNFAQF